MTTKAKQAPDKFRPGWIDQLDGRTQIAAAMNARYKAFTDDLGGEQSLSYAQKSLVERALYLEMWIATQELALAQGKTEDFDRGGWIQALNGLQGLLSKLGLHRQAREMNLGDYMAAKKGGKA